MAWHTSDLVVVFEDVIHLLAVEGAVERACSLRVELEAVAQLLQHSCLGGGSVQPATRHLLPQQAPAARRTMSGQASRCQAAD